MDEGLGCLFTVIALVILVFAFSALGFCGPDAAEQAKYWMGK